MRRHRDPPSRALSGPARVWPPALTAAVAAAVAAAVIALASTPSAGRAAVAENESLPRLLRVEPPRDSARHLGDIVVYRALVAWPAGWEVDRDGVRAPAREDGPLELRGYQIEPAAGECSDCHWLTVQWQLFKAVHITSDVPLPKTPVRLRRGTQVTELTLPASRLAVSPLVPWERRENWVDSVRPGWVPSALDIRARLLEAFGWLAATILALAGWAWSSGQWLPRRSARPFAEAWRTVKSRRHADAGAVPQADADDLRCWHRAFDVTAGEVVFADRLDAFFTTHPGYAPLADDVQAIFMASQRSFFLDPRSQPGTRIARDHLIELLRALADREFSFAPRRRRSPAERKGHA